MARVSVLPGVFGLFSVMAYGVSQRMKELGIRLAICANCATGVFLRSEARFCAGLGRNHHRLVWIMGADRMHKEPAF